MSKFIDGIRSMFRGLWIIVMMAVRSVRKGFSLFVRGKNVIIEKIRFSIKMKMALTYTISFLFITILMNIGVLISFHYFIERATIKQYSLILVSTLVGYTVLGTVLICITGFRSAKKILRPVKEMTSLVQEISVHDMEQRINIAGSKNELKDLAQTFNLMMDRLQASMEQQNRFVSDASHELRTPIAVIQGYANLLDRWGKDDPEVLNEGIQALKTEGEAMKNLVENLLFLARGDQQRQVIDKQEFALDELIEEIIRESRMIDQEHQINSQKCEKAMFYGDRKLIKEAIRIFMDNSMKYTPTGGTIKLNSYVIGNGLFIVIEDNGIGIDEKDIPHIFNRFYRADESRTKGSGGTGLGLAIAKYIIDCHDGEVKVYSQLNKGTVITLRFDQGKRK